MTGRPEHRTNDTTATVLNCVGAGQAYGGALLSVLRAQQQLARKRGMVLIVSFHFALQPQPDDPAVVMLDEDAFFLPLQARGCWFSVPQLNDLQCVGSML